ncbi:hypothetical protein SAY86_008803 [Trapa natans]|uniref:Uncharacterized protein n=1 Tax=Trapa natans TaxID=22666 RepID=A0AAN7K979_TRANT|nr:hypothetical protein SAY86_008803 [Trapa natans]
MTDSYHTSPKKSNFDAADQWETDSPSYPGEGSTSGHQHHHNHQFSGRQNHQRETEMTGTYAERVEAQGQNPAQEAAAPPPQHNIDIEPGDRDFSFDRRTGGT